MFRTQSFSESVQNTISCVPSHICTFLCHCNTLPYHHCCFLHPTLDPQSPQKSLEWHYSPHTSKHLSQNRYRHYQDIDYCVWSVAVTGICVQESCTTKSLSKISLAKLMLTLSESHHSGRWGPACPRALGSRPQHWRQAPGHTCRHVPQTIHIQGL